MAQKKTTKKKTRKRLKEETPVSEEESTGKYFSETNEKQVLFVPTGCALLDSVLGGGYAFGRIINIVGDKSTSKTGSGIEATANFLEKWLEGKVVYAEAEAAFDKEYAKSLGMPVDKIEFREEDSENEILTVEDFYNDLINVCKQSVENNEPTLYILDSLDALSDEAEMERGISEGTYGASKARQMSQVFRRVTKQMNKSNVTLIIISQTRDNIGVSFGKQYSRSGGKSLDFYASQIIYLAHAGQIPKTIRGVKKIIGVQIKAKCTKNKAGVPFRECEYPYRFNFGIDDTQASIDWLDKNDFLSQVTDKKKKDYEKYINSLDNEGYWQEADKLSSEVKKIWDEVESEFQPKFRKYK